ncbi:hypothetical protein ACFL59_15600 [Planctomycetota bacterium]
MYGMAFAILLQMHGFLLQQKTRVQDRLSILPLVDTSEMLKELDAKFKGDMTKKLVLELSYCCVRAAGTPRVWSWQERSHRGRVEVGAVAIGGHGAAVTVGGRGTAAVGRVGMRRQTARS